jgi:hypothetical protein
VAVVVVVDVVVAEVTDSIDDVAESFAAVDLLLVAAAAVVVGNLVRLAHAEDTAAVGHRGDEVDAAAERRRQPEPTSGGRSEYEAERDWEIRRCPG